MEALSSTDSPVKRTTTTNNTSSLSVSQATSQANHNKYYALPSGDDELDINVTLTPEDENNPELLAELSSILSSGNPSPVAETVKFDRVTDLKKEILRLKMEGDIEGAKAKLLELNQLEGSKSDNRPENKNLCTEGAEPVQKSSIDPKCVLECAPVSPLIPNSPSSSSPKVAASDTQVYRDLFSKLQKQSGLCQTISEFYTSANRRPDATLFIKRKQALDLELQKLRLMLKSKQAAPQSKIVNVTYEYVLGNPDIAEGQLQVSIGQLKVILPRKFKLKDDEEYRMKVTYEISGLNEQEITQTSEPFTTSGLMNSNRFNGLSLSFLLCR